MRTTYNVRTGVSKEKLISLKKRMLGVAAVLGIVGTVAAPTFAIYGSQPGFDVSNSHTTCAGHGAFGAFGDKGDVTHDFGVNNPGSNNKPGADGQQTGINNSTLCGNPQN
jgi:hypothetical protein